MSLWKKIVVVNGGALVGVFISLFIVSPHTPLWLWAAVSGGWVAALNYLFFGRKQRAGERMSGTEITVRLALGGVVLLLGLILRYLR